MTWLEQKDERMKETVFVHQQLLDPQRETCEPYRRSTARFSSSSEREACRVPPLGMGDSTYTQHIIIISLYFVHYYIITSQ